MAMGSHGGPLPSDFRENQERKEPRRFKAGDRVRVNASCEDEDVNEYLQEDNRVGTVVDAKSSHNYYWLHMDKPVIYDDGRNIPFIIPDGHAYFASREEIELLESVPESQKPFDIKAWRKNLKPGDKVRVVANPEKVGTTLRVSPIAMHKLEKWKGKVVTLESRIISTAHDSAFWKIKGDGWLWHPQFFEPLDESKPTRTKKIKEPQKQPPDPRLKTIVQTALELTQAIETTFKDSEKYPIFGMNLAKQEPVEKTRKLELNESFYSLGIVLYHLFTGQSEHNNHSFLLDGYPKPEDMSEGFWQVVNKLLKGEYRGLSEFKKDLKQLKRVLEKGVVEDLGKSEESKEGKEIKKIWQTQIDRLIELGYRKALNVSKEELARAIPLPGSWMENPLLVVPKNMVGIQQQIKMIEVDGKRGECVINLDEIKNLAGIETPNIFYWIDLIQDGREYLGKSVNDCLESFAKNERGLTVAEGIALVAQYPQALKHHHIHLIGFQSGDCVTTLWINLDQGCTPMLSWWHLPSKSPEWGAASCYYASQEQTNKDSS